MFDLNHYNDLNTLSFDQDENGAWGYKVGGADTVIPFKSNSSEIILNFNQIVSQNQNFIQTFNTNLNILTGIDITPTGNSNIKNINFLNGILEINFLRSNSSSEITYSSLKFSNNDNMREETVIKNFYVSAKASEEYIESSFNIIYGIKSIKFTKSTDSWTSFRGFKLVENRLIIYTQHPYSSSNHITAEIVFIGE